GFDTQPLEYCPMPLARLHNLAIWLIREVVAEGKRLFDGTGILEDAAIGRDPYNCAQRVRRNAELRIARGQLIETTMANGMSRHIISKCVDEHVHIWQVHLSRSIYSRSSTSCSAAVSFISIPGIKPPVALLTGGGI